MLRENVIVELKNYCIGCLLVHVANLLFHKNTNKNGQSKKKKKKKKKKNKEKKKKKTEKNEEH